MTIILLLYCSIFWVSKWQRLISNRAQEPIQQLHGFQREIRTHLTTICWKGSTRGEWNQEENQNKRVHRAVGRSLIEKSISLKQNYEIA